MNILEREIEDVVWQAMITEPSLLYERGFPFKKRYTYVRQLALGVYGRADIVGFYTETYKSKGGDRIVAIDIIELKKDEINTSAFLQALAYARGLQVLFDNQKVSFPIEFNFYLIGKTIDEVSDFVFMTDVFQNIELYTYSIDLEKGMVFTRHSGYGITDHVLDKGAPKIFSILKTNVRNNFKLNHIKELEDADDNLSF